jgi:hypothetical protein
MSLANRPRNHILEELSVAHLRSTLPQEWQISETTHDYGIDVQIEIFTKDGKRTGVKFNGQIKATDNSVIGDALQIDRSHIDYWLHHSDPVVIFRYHDSTKAFRWCWVDEIAWRLNTDSQTIEISSYLKEWDPQKSPTEIEGFLAMRRKAASLLAKPYKISVINAVQGSAGAAITAAEIEQILGRDDFRVLTNPDAQGDFQVIVDEKRIAVSYCGLPGVVCYLEPNAPAKDRAGAALMGVLLCSLRFDRERVTRALVDLTLPLLFETALQKEHLEFEI